MLNRFHIRVESTDNGFKYLKSKSAQMNDCLCMDIVTWSGKMLDHAKVTLKKIVNDNVDDGVKPNIPIQVKDDENSSNEDKLCVDEKQEVDPPKMLIDGEGKIGDKFVEGDESKSPPPYLQRVIKEKEDKQFEKLIDLLSNLSVNIPSIDDLLPMLGYSAFMK